MFHYIISPPFFFMNSMILLNERTLKVLLVAEIDLSPENQLDYVLRIILAYILFLLSYL